METTLYRDSGYSSVEDAPPVAVANAPLPDVFAGMGGGDGYNSEDNGMLSKKSRAAAREKGKKSRARDLPPSLNEGNKLDMSILDGGDHNEFNTHIHIRIQQRNGRKWITYLEGLPSQFDLKRMLKYFTKAFACQGTVVKDKSDNKFIRLSGDQRVKLHEFLVGEGIAGDKNIHVHGM
ncbi:Eukaryotic translation initiation factor eIF-1 [Coemansia javaensis]|uniref:Eukaryotic translation initiation factor eIF-1 n=1 Tax=Coemansia javaensis TaxID=2761396 RepID=A0A9W8LIT0_9FUNG|nr:Eukaryotic translation initiation factor eIF-1 [Coemansia javaensis]